MSRRRKLELFASLIESRLLYGLTGAWLRVAERRRLDGFHARCLRQILKIPPAYFSRISNQKVLASAGRPKASTMLCRRQLVHFGKVLRSPSGSVLKDVSFIGDTLAPATTRYVRRVGRPRQEWIPCVLSEAGRITGASPSNLHTYVNDHKTWKNFVNRSVLYSEFIVSRSMLVKRRC